MNGIRLGMYDNLKTMTTPPSNPTTKAVISIIFSGLSGFTGGFFGSPFNQVKVRLMLASNFLS
jgi:hypothetical protein